MQTISESDTIRTLEMDPSARGKKPWRRWSLVALLAVTAVIIISLVRGSKALETADYITQQARRGDMFVTITATGTVQPTNQVEVGSELSGIIERVDVDYNSRVEVGQVLAQLDTSRLKTEVLQSRAALESAQAQVLQALANVKEARNYLDKLNKVRSLSDGKVPSQNDLAEAETALDRALANEAGTKAGVSQARATLEMKQTDLAKAVIRSPIQGIVLSRSVEPGQTVAASFQSPVLFTLAEDLSQMELLVDVDEADVGQVQEGQEASFTVDAYPERTFAARIEQVRYGSTTTNGVVTYKTVLSVDNSDLSLRPGMTATADITVQKIKDALLIPNAALRFSPPVEIREEPIPKGSMVSMLFPHPPARHASPGEQPDGKDAEETGGNRRSRQVWTLRKGALVAMAITIGATNGVMTQMVSGDITPGTALVTGRLDKEE